MIKRQQYYTCTQSSGDGAVTFGFAANWVRVYLGDTGPLYINFAATSGSTGGYAMTSGDSPQTFTDGWMSAMGFATTTTAINFRVYAMGSGG
jgi:hypothetical protein